MGGQNHDGLNFQGREVVPSVKIMAHKYNHDDYVFYVDTWNLDDEKRIEFFIKIKEHLDYKIKEIKGEN